MKKVYNYFLFFVILAFPNVSLASHTGQLCVTAGSSIGFISEDLKKKSGMLNDTEIQKTDFNSHMTSFGGLFKYHYLSDNFFTYTIESGYLHSNMYFGIAEKNKNMEGLSMGGNDSMHVIRLLTGPAVNFLSDNNGDDDDPKFILGLLLGTSIRIYTEINDKGNFERSWGYSGIIGLNIEYISKSGFFGSIVPTFETFKYSVPINQSNGNNNNGAKEDKTGNLYFVNFELQVGWNIFNF